MKGSIKVKFDFGWIFGAVLAAGVLIIGAGRFVTVTEIQKQYENSCNVGSQIVDLSMKIQGFEQDYYQMSYLDCLSLARPTTALVSDLSVVDFGTAYPGVIIPDTNSYATVERLKKKLQEMQ